MREREEVLIMAVALERDVLFPKLLTKADNRRCFDCNKANPKWCSWRFGVLICMDCAALHRQMGVHISQVKSCELDEWDYEQLCVFECSGGNKRAKDFFAKNVSDSSPPTHTHTTTHTHTRSLSISY